MNPRTLRLVLLTALALAVYVAFFSVPAQAQEWTVYPAGAQDNVNGKWYPATTEGPLKLAVEHSRAGDTIVVHGQVPGVAMAIGENYRAHQVVRADPIDVRVIGATPEAAVGPCEIAGKQVSGGLPGFAVEGFHLQDITLDARGAQRGFAVYMATRCGDVSMTNVTIRSNKWTKWGIRAHGHSRSFRLRSVDAPDGGIEHPWYIDNPTGLPLDGGPSLLISNCTANGWGRTAGQVVTREWPTYGYRNPGPALGPCIYEFNTATDCGWEGGNGGSAFTVAAWPESYVRFDSNSCSSPYEVGAIAAWGDTAMLGEAMTRPGGYVFAKVVIRSNQVDNPNGVRDQIAVQNAEVVELRVGRQRENVIRSANRGYNFAHKGGHPGSLEIHAREKPSTWHGLFVPRPWMLGTKEFDPDTRWVDPAVAEPDPDAEPAPEPDAPADS